MVKTSEIVNNYQTNFNSISPGDLTILANAVFCALQFETDEGENGRFGLFVFLSRKFLSLSLSF